MTASWVTSGLLGFIAAMLVLIYFAILGTRGK
jgi:hypothetical protein